MIFFGLRLHHVPLNIHLKRIGVIADSSCPFCPCPDETVTHLLLQCPERPPNRTENTTQVRVSLETHTSSLFMSSGKRAKAQMLLDQQKIK